MRDNPRPMVEPKYNVPMDLFDGHAYAGGSARLFTLRAILGDKLFWTGIRRFLADYAFKAANTDQFFDSMSKGTSVDLSWFDKQYFHTASLPKISSSQVTTTVTLTQPDPPFTLDVDFWELVKGDWKKSTVALHGKSADIKLANASDPYLIDPEVNLTASISYPTKFRPDVVSALYDHAPNAAQKLRLAEMAASAGESNLVSTMALKEQSAPLRHEIIKLVAGSQTAALLKLSASEDPLDRINALDKMSDAKNAAYIPRLRDVWKSTASQPERASALRGLLQTTDGAGYAGKAYHKLSFGDEFQIEALNWYRFNKKDKARALALSLLSGKASENLRVAAIATLGTVKDKSGDKTALKELLARLSDKSLHEKEAAIQALSSEGYGSAEALPELHKLDDFSMYQIRVEALTAESRLGAKTK